MSDNPERALRHYIYIARADHWFKNIFIFPGVLVAIVLCGAAPDLALLWRVFLSFSSCCLVASANYVINEWLDSEFDRHHPVKKSRPGASGLLRPRLVYLEYAVLALCGLLIGAAISVPYLLASLVLLGMGVLYNVKPFRTKDRVYLDVASESFNNPLRFILGWLAVTGSLFPPSSILLAYWAGGGFLMAVKRYAEFRYIADPERAGLYRRSFRSYTEKNLLLCSIFCAITSCFFLAVFLIKYRAEFILSFPFFSALFVWYLALGMRPLSAAQSPEKLYREKWFSLYVIFLAALSIGLLFVDIPLLHFVSEPVRFSG